MGGSRESPVKAHFSSHHIIKTWKLMQNVKYKFTFLFSKEFNLMGPKHGWERTHQD
jgi:hypothetical protein